MNKRPSASLLLDLSAAMPLLLVIGLTGCHKPDILDARLEQDMRDYLADVSAWIMTLDLDSGFLKNTPHDAKTYSSSAVCINGNFARTLLASYRVSGNKAHLEEGLRWCDFLVAHQQPAIASTGEPVGYWPDRTMTGNIYIADAGSAATALALAYRLADSQRQVKYLDAMEKYVRFVTNGTSADPQGKGRGVCTGWIVKEGDNRGVLGCGYYRGHLSVLPYTISTATTGGAFFAELFAITGKAEHQDVARQATKWLLQTRQADGTIPYTLDGRTLTEWPLTTLSYCAEAFIAAGTHLKDPGLRDLLGRELSPSVRWLLAGQNPDGSWGTMRSKDQQRSPRAVSLLAWYYRNIDADPRITEAIRGYCRFLLDPEKSQTYGVKQLVRTSCFVGQVVADLVKPGSSF